MTALTYACAVRTGKEHDVAADLRALHIWADFPRMLTTRRVGPARDREHVEVAMWPGYVFATMDARQLFDAWSIKHLHPTRLTLRDCEVTGLRCALEAAETALQTARRRAEAPEAAEIPDFAAGEALQIVAGPFADRMARFCSMIRRAGWADHPALEIEIDGLPGRATVPLDMVQRAG